MLFAFGGIEVIVIVWQISVKNILFHIQLIEVEHRRYTHRAMAAEGEYILFLEHDFESECCTVQQTEKGVRLKDKGRLSDFF